MNLGGRMLEAKSLYGMVCAYSVMSDSLWPPWIAALQAPLFMEFSRQEILEWVATSFSRRSSRPRDQTCVSCISCFGRGILYHLCLLGISPSNLYAEALSSPPVRLYLETGPLRVTEVKWGHKVRPWSKRINILTWVARERYSFTPFCVSTCKERPCEHKARRQVSAVQKETFTRHLLATWPWTVSLQNCEENSFYCFKPSGLFHDDSASGLIN